jgi:hypothetical protein
MDIRKKNLILAAVIGLIAVSLYVFSIYKVITAKPEVSISGQQR